MKGFASDNYSGVHPRILEAIVRANVDHDVSYGDDDVTARLAEAVRAHFGETAEAFAVFNGTGANVTALQAMAPQRGAVVCSQQAHIHQDEAGAPEHIAGLKLFTVPTPDGKLTPELVDREAWGFGNVHRAQPRVLALSQSTEVGTVYTPEELRALCDHAHSLGMKVYVDGARLSNAAAALGVSLRQISTDVGADVVSFGGTKNGLLLGELIVVLNPDAVTHLADVRKMNMQLASKMRFISAQFEAVLANDLWRETANHANAMAQRLREQLEHAQQAGNAPGLEFTQLTQANAVFAALPPAATSKLLTSHRFYEWDATRHEVRWMTAFDTTEAEVDEFAAAISQVLLTTV